MSIKDIDNRFKKYPRASAVMIEREEWESVKESIASLESFVMVISEQVPEMPDDWSTCGQCGDSISKAEHLIEVIQG